MFCYVYVRLWQLVAIEQSHIEKRFEGANKLLVLFYVVKRDECIFGKALAVEYLILSLCAKDLSKVERLNNSENWMLH